MAPRGMTKGKLSSIRAPSCNAGRNIEFLSSLLPLGIQYVEKRCGDSAARDHLVALLPLTWGPLRLLLRSP